MKHSSLLKRVAFACLLLVVAVLIDVMVTTGERNGALLLTVVTSLYLIQLVLDSKYRVGRFLLLCLGQAILAFGFIFFDSILSLTVVCVVLIWLSRSLLSYPQFWMLLLDGLLSMFGLAFAVWIYRHSGSLLIAIWSFLLIQCLQAMFPGFERRSMCFNNREKDHFDQAFQEAENILARKFSDTEKDFF